MKGFTFLVFLFISQLSSGQVTNVKTGLWSDASVWSNNVLPTDTTNVILNFNVVVDKNAICKSLNSNGYNVTVNTGVILITSGSNFIPDSTFTDLRDGQVYTFRHIGSQVWMTKNLNYALAGSRCYDDNPTKCAVYGRFYTWIEAVSSVPTGWHLPTKPEWEELITHLGGAEVAGGKIKSNDTLWQQPNIGADNSSGFNALPAGVYTPGYATRPPYNGMGAEGDWWSGTRFELNGINVSYAFYVRRSNVILNWFESIDNIDAFSVRCVRDY